MLQVRNPVSVAWWFRVRWFLENQIQGSGAQQEYQDALDISAEREILGQKVKGGGRREERRNSTLLLHWLRPLPSISRSSGPFAVLYSLSCRGLPKELGSPVAEIIVGDFSFAHKCNFSSIYPDLYKVNFIQDVHSDSAAGVLGWHLCQGADLKRE